MAATNNSTENTLVHMSLTWGPKRFNISTDDSSPLTGFHVLISSSLLVLLLLLLQRRIVAMDAHDLTATFNGKANRKNTRLRY